MGLFNLLSPLFNALDDAMAWLMPAALRIAVFAALLSIATTLLYKILSPQARIGQAKRDAREARRRLNQFDGEFADAGPLIKNQFTTAFRHIGLVVPGTVIAILPLLCFLVWADNHFDHRLPSADEQAPAIALSPRRAPDVVARWQAHAQSNALPAVSLAIAAHRQRSYPMRAPVTVIAKHSPWNWLVGNPLGYLPADVPIDAIRIDLPRREFLPFGPAWMRGWLAVFIPVMFVVSLLMFRWARIE